MPRPQAQFQQSQPQFREGGPEEGGYDEDRQMNGRPRDRFGGPVTPALVAEATKRMATIEALNANKLDASAYTAVDRAESERERAFAVNATGPKTLAEWCTQRGAALLHVSTDYVFDGSQPGPYPETAQTAPLGAYGESKLAGEDAIRAVALPHLILRTSWVYGLRGRNFLLTIRRLAAERSETRLAGLPGWVGRVPADGRSCACRTSSAARPGS